MDRASSFTQSALRKVKGSVDYLSTFPKHQAHLAIYVVGLAGLFLAGASAIYYQLNGGAIQLNLHDWAEVTAPRYAFLKDAVETGQLPLHMPGEWALRNVTDRFIAVADTNLGPQVLLLKYVDVGRFVFLNTLFLYTIGFAGLILLARHLRLSLLAFSALFGLLNFNGHIVSHLAVGHVNWAAYYLTPFFGYLLLRLFEGWDGWRWIAATGLYLFVLLLQGAFHFFVAHLLFLGLLWLFNPEFRRTVFSAGLATAGLGAVRLLPPLLELGKFDTEFLSGYPTVSHLLAAFVELRATVTEEVFLGEMFANLNWWEFNLYIGAAGAAFLGYFAVARFLSPEAARLRRGLAPPLLIMITLSIGQLYQVFHMLRIPLLSSQRVSSRMVFIPIALLLILAAWEWQRRLDQKEQAAPARAIGLLLLPILANDLWQHLKLWRVTHMGRLFPPKDLDLAVNVVANHSDPPYQLMLILGLSLSLVTAIVLIYVTRRAPPDPHA